MEWANCMERQFPKIDIHHPSTWFPKTTPLPYLVPNPSHPTHLVPYPTPSPHGTQPYSTSTAGIQPFAIALSGAQLHTSYQPTTLPYVILTPLSAQFADYPPPPPLHPTTWSTDPLRLPQSLEAVYSGGSLGAIHPYTWSTTLCHLPTCYPNLHYVNNWCPTHTS